jgi:hypothetical protein
MINTKLLSHIHSLALPTTKYFFQLNAIQPRCLLHTSLPLLNKDVAKIDWAEEQPHMRIEAKAMIEHKRMYKEEQW